MYLPLFLEQKSCPPAPNRQPQLPHPASDPSFHPSTFIPASTPASFDLFFRLGKVSTNPADVCGPPAPPFRPTPSAALQRRLSIARSVKPRRLPVLQRRLSIARSRRSQGDCHRSIGCDKSLSQVRSSPLTVSGPVDYRPFRISRTSRFSALPHLSDKSSLP